MEGEGDWSFSLSFLFFAFIFSVFFSFVLNWRIDADWVRFSHSNRSLSPNDPFFFPFLFLPSLDVLSIKEKKEGEKEREWESSKKWREGKGRIFSKVLPREVNEGCIKFDEGSLGYSILCVCKLHLQMLQNKGNPLLIAKQSLKMEIRRKEHEKRNGSAGS